eukprot:11832114-Alexandrium_andersonii.AAC.1
MHGMATSGRLGHVSAHNPGGRRHPDVVDALDSTGVDRRQLTDNPHIGQSKHEGRPTFEVLVEVP